jgi:hypothetical protein
MKNFSIQCLIVGITTILVSYYQVHAQQEPPVTHQPQGVAYNVPPIHHAAFGLSLASGSPNLGRDAGDVMISMLYAYRYTQTNEVELSLNYMPVQRLRELDGRVFSDSLGYISLAWMGDVSFMFQPFSGIFRGLRIGIGPTLAMQSFMMKSAGQRSSIGGGSNGQLFLIDSNGIRTPYPIITVPAYPDTYRAEGLSIGVNLKMEYLVPLTRNLEFCLRAQMQAFMPTNLVSTDGIGVGIGGNVGSIGGMLRVGW